MSEAAAPTYTIAANGRWFALVYTAITLLLAVIVGVAYEYGVEIPTTGVNIGAFAGVASIAGQRFATRRDWTWTSKERHQLALTYMALSCVTSFALFAVLLAIDATTRDAVMAMVSQLGGFIAAIFVVVALVFYGMARVMLAIIAKRGKRQ